MGRLKIHKTLAQQLLLLCILLGMLVAVHGIYTTVTIARHIEVIELSFARGWDTQQYQEYFERLARNRGAVYAYDVLREASIPENVDTHEIGHSIGWVLYEEKGIAGMAYCTESFRSACAHALVISAYVERGEAALPQIVKACEEAPGDKGAYATCFHGMGHGILAYFGYDYEQALGKCEEVGDLLTLDDSRTTSREVWNRCVEGATMELDLGTHDPALWEQAKLVYFPDNDLYMPCNAAYVNPEVRPMCYSYLTWRFLEAAGASRGVSSVDTYAQAMMYCRAIEDPKERSGCYGGFGKNFVYQATLDERKARTLSNEALSLMTTWCGAAGTAEGEESCMLAVLNGLDLATLTGSEAATRLCALQSAGVVQDSCYTHLMYNGQYYFNETGELSTFCKTLPEGYQQQCLSFTGSIYAS